MATYESILHSWFFLLHPDGTTFDQFEGEPATEDRERTRLLFTKMLDEVPASARRVLGLSHLPFDRSGLALLDEKLTPAAVQPLLDLSNPDDPNNHFKLTLSEFAVYFGELLIGALGAEWHYARMPNF